MGGFRYPDINTLGDFKKEFRYSLAPGELGKDKDTRVVRFDLIRQVFLDRGL